MEQAEPSAAKRKELREIGKAVSAMRFQFDPYNGAHDQPVRPSHAAGKGACPQLMPTRPESGGLPVQPKLQA